MHIVFPLSMFFFFYKKAMHIVSLLSYTANARSGVWAVDLWLAHMISVPSPLSQLQRAG